MDKKGEAPLFEAPPRLKSFTLSRIQVRRVYTCSAFPAPEIGPGRLVGAKPTGPELTLTRRCWPLVGRVRRWGRYPSTCQRQKVT
jgi:hypothetical protein